MGKPIEGYSEGKAAKSSESSQILTESISICGPSRCSFMPIGRTGMVSGSRGLARRESCACDLYFLRLKDSSSLIAVDANLLDSATDYFKKKVNHDYQLSNLSTIDLHEVRRSLFDNLLYCLRKKCFPDQQFPDNQSKIQAASEVFNLSHQLNVSYSDQLALFIGHIDAIFLVLRLRAVQLWTNHLQPNHAEPVPA
ncbi:unnamed protein product [Protopolystoma xenopodis]|uniref:BTB domain-containing protein n=1 Tax=Protopolystoma xenopodis TaxID=117903 RepID=A0A3S4ZZQ7_9PLAT|nr:unnamed protein product [Protopolystoma xenopodis]